MADPIVLFDSYYFDDPRQALEFLRHRYAALYSTHQAEQIVNAELREQLQVEISKRELAELLLEECSDECR